MKPKTDIKNRTDVLTPEQRRLCMSRNRGKDTKPEVILRKELWKKGLRYRLHYDIPGKPDFVFVGKRIAVFVDGCFWHNCPLHGTKPKTNRKFWEDKISKNVERDKKVTRELISLGWKILRFWEHEIKEDVNGVQQKIVDLYEAK